MVLTNREKNLLILLSIAVFVALFVNYFLFPQLDRLSEARAEKEALQVLIQEIEEYDNPQSPPRQQIRQMEEQILEESASFFPQLIQDRLILVIDGMFNRANMNPTNISFTPVSASSMESIQANTPPAPSAFGDMARSYRGESNGEAATEVRSSSSLDKMEVTLQARGTYGEVMGVFNQIETHPRRVHISRVTLNRDAQGVLTANMAINFYGIPKPIDQDFDYLNWGIFDVYGRDNPFLP